MNRSKMLLMAGITLAIIVGILLASRSPTSITAQKVSATGLDAEQQGPAVSVEVAEVQMGAVKSTLGYSGNVRAVDKVSVLSKVGGRVEEVNVDIGDVVKKGDQLARLDADTSNAQLLQAMANMYASRAKLAQMEDGARSEQIAQAVASLKASQARLDRIKAPLNQNEIDMVKAGEVQARAALQAAQAAYDKISWYDGKGMLPQSVALQQATTAYEAAKAAYQEKLAGAKPEDIRAAEAAVEQEKAKLALIKKPYQNTDLQLARANVLQAEAVVYAARLQVKEATIKAPMDGIVAESPLVVGAIVDTKTPVVTLVTPKMEVAVKVEESRIADLKSGQPATIRVSAFPDQEFPGKVTRISPTADSADRTFEVRIVPDATDERLKSGMFADVNLTTELRSNVLMVPKTAVMRDGDKRFVFTVADGQAERREVKVGLADGDKVEIVSGLVLGEQVVSAGQAGLKSGDLVKVAASQG
jgi:HlyD family secretion protein